jgi:hypothetical protein
MLTPKSDLLNTFNLYQVLKGFQVSTATPQATYNEFLASLEAMYPNQLANLVEVDTGPLMGQINTYELTTDQVLGITLSESTQVQGNMTEWLDTVVHFAPA